MSLSVSQRTVLSLAAVVFAAAGPALADWLVLHDGSRVETKGAWQVKGKQVVFTSVNGKLSALRAVDVDFDASATATTNSQNAAVAPPVEEPAAKKKPVLVLTDKDVGHVDAATVAAENEAAKGEKKAADAPVAVGAVQILSWEKAATADGNGTEIFGSLKNTGSDTATDIEVVAKVYDSEGTMLGTANATISAGALPPNGVTNFRASFPGIILFATAKFQIQSRGVITTPPPAPDKPPVAR